MLPGGEGIVLGALLLLLYRLGEHGRHAGLLTVALTVAVAGLGVGDVPERFLLAHLQVTRKLFAQCLVD